MYSLQFLLEANWLTKFREQLYIFRREFPSIEWVFVYKIVHAKMLANIIHTLTRKNVGVIHKTTFRKKRRRKIEELSQSLCV